MVTQSLLDLNTRAATLESDTLAAAPYIQPSGMAKVPAVPFQPRPTLWTLIGLAAGVLLAFGIVALVEYLDNTVKPETNIVSLAHAPVLASVSELPRLQAGSSQVYSVAQPQSAAAEAIRLLRTNLEFASASGKIKRLVITSPGPGEGKSTIAANLATVMARGGLKTVLIDADLRKPTQHDIFGVSNHRGLTNLLMNPDTAWEEIARECRQAGLMVIPSGPLPPNPYELVSSPRFTSVLDAISASADLVIIDTPPVLSASDTLAVAAAGDGAIMVCRSRATRVEALQGATEAVHQGGIRLVGVVLNGTKRQRAAAYYGKPYGAQGKAAHAD